MTPPPGPPPTPPSVRPPPLTKGVDYYIENGRWVFTADFLRRRGTCCDSGCRHCPYPKPPAST
jgi:hypothetical protein